MSCPTRCRPLQTPRQGHPERRRAGEDAASSCTCAPARSTAAASAVDAGAGTPSRPARRTSACTRSAAWREAPHFNDAERAALALAEATTRIADEPEAVSDAIWNEAAKHYDEKKLGGLVLRIALTNLFNRVNVTTRQVAGSKQW